MKKNNISQLILKNATWYKLTWCWFVLSFRAKFTNPERFLKVSFELDDHIFVVVSYLSQILHMHFSCQNEQFASSVWYFDSRVTFQKGLSKTSLKIFQKYFLKTFCSEWSALFGNILDNVWWTDTRYRKKLYLSILKNKTKITIISKKIFLILFIFDKLKRIYNVVNCTMGQDGGKVYPKSLLSLKELKKQSYWVIFRELSTDLPHHILPQT